MPSPNQLLTIQQHNETINGKSSSFYYNIDSREMTTTSDASSSFVIPMYVSKVKMIHLESPMSFSTFLSYIGGLFAALSGILAFTLGKFNENAFYNEVIHQDPISKVQEKKIKELNDKILEKYTEEKDFQEFEFQDELDKECLMLDKHFFKYDVELDRVKNVRKYHFKAKEENWGLFKWTQSQEFRQKVKMFTEAISYENFYKMNDGLEQTEKFMEEQKAQSTDQNERIISLESENMMLIEKVSLQERQNVKLENQNKEQSKKIFMLENQNEEQSKKIVTLENQNEELRGKIDEQKSHIDELKSDMQD